jgi:hypothetical protein
MKNTLYAIISSLLVMTILFMLFTNLDLFNQSVVEGNKSKNKEKAKAAAKPIRQNVKKTAKKVCVGKGCNQTQNSDIVSDAPTTRMDDMRRSLDMDNEQYIKDLTE